LRLAGRASFATLGLRKTAVDDLVKAAGISKGAFYLFYDSKEALLLELLEHLERELQGNLLRQALNPELSARQSLELLVHETLTARSADPLLRRLTAEDLEQLSRRVSPERAEALRRQDVDAVSRWMYHWRARGTVIMLEAEVLAGLLRALMFASFHETEIGASVYPRVLDTLVQGVVGKALIESVEEKEHVAAPERRTLGDRRARSLESRLQG